MKAQELFEEITNKTIAAIEAGAGQWKLPWHNLADAGTPVNVEGRAYRGINALWLPFVADEKGYTSGIWGTYRAWQKAGAQVREKEKSTKVILWKPTKRKDENGEEKDSLFATTFSVFAAEQVDGAEAIIEKLRPTVERDSVERIESAEAYFAAIGANVKLGGNRAAYSPSSDHIVCPTLAQFDSAPHFYTTLAHEHVHLTGHESRLDRDLSGRFGSESYGAEELVAELGAAFWSAQHGLSNATRDDHAKYLGSWLNILKADPRALQAVASKAQKAIDFLNDLVEAQAAQAAA